MSKRNDHCGDEQHALCHEQEHDCIEHVLRAVLEDEAGGNTKGIDGCEGLTDIEAEHGE